MEKDIVKEICKNLEWYDVIVVRTFKRLFVKIYNAQRIKYANLLLH